MRRYGLFTIFIFFIHAIQAQDRVEVRHFVWEEQSIDVPQNAQWSVHVGDRIIYAQQNKIISATSSNGENDEIAELQKPFFPLFNSAEKVILAPKDSTDKWGNEFIMLSFDAHWKLESLSTIPHDFYEIDFCFWKDQLIAIAAFHDRLGFYSLDMDNPQGNWKLMKEIETRADRVEALVQFDGRQDVLYSLTNYQGKSKLIRLGLIDSKSLDIEELSPLNVPEEIRSAKVLEGFATGQGHLYFFLEEGNQFMLWSFHTISDTWHRKMLPTMVSFGSLLWSNGKITLIDGNSTTYQGLYQHPGRDFGVVNYTTLAVYLVVLVLVGVYFASRNRNADDYFQGGQRLPAWAAGLSIFATILSSITFIATPAKTFATDWTFILFSVAATLVAPFIVVYVLPFFRKINSSSAYAYLEKRFNVWIRLFGSASFILFQIGRMAIVMYLPSLALSAITGLSVEQCILIIGVLSIIYCTFGGLEAVIWTDAIQTFILLGGALLSVGVIIGQLDNGLADFIGTGREFNKFRIINWDWSKTSMIGDALWVLVLGSIGQNVISYSSDQAVIQRYLSVNSDKKARKAIYMNAAIMIPANLIFFCIGAALFVFYKQYPERLDTTLQTDGIFPYFIATELPVGLAGLVVAGIFAAAQSTISTSMNSTATTLVNDFFQRFNVLKDHINYLFLGRLMTIIMGALGTGVALLLATQDVKSLWESFITIVGLFGGSLCGLFLLGMFTKVGNTKGAIFGAIFGVLSLLYVSNFTPLNSVMYSFIAVSTSFVVGWVVSLISSKSKNNETSI